MTNPAPAIALLHGGGQGAWVWDPLFPHLGDTRILSLDVPGCGKKRGRDLSDIDTDGIAAELVDDLANAGLDNVMLVGHSLAGAIMPRMAALQPGRFSRLVYLSCSAPRKGVSFLQQIGNGLHGSHPDEVGWPIDPATSEPSDRYRVMFCNDMSEAEGSAFLGRLGEDNWPGDVFVRTDHEYEHLRAIPSTYIVCERDMILPPEWQRRFAGRLHCESIVSLDAGHQAMVTAPEELGRLLLVEVCAL